MTEQSGPPSGSPSTSHGLRLRIELPFLLPTQNCLDSLSLRRRIRLKTFIRDFVSASIIEAGGSQTPRGAVIRPPWTELLAAEYWAMTHRSGSSLLRLLRLSVKKARKSRR